MARYTTEEIEDNYEFKVIKRLLKKEYPFILDMKLTDNWNDYNSLFFVDLTVSLPLLREYLNLPNNIIPSIFSRSLGSTVPYLSMFFSSSQDKDGLISDLAKKIQSTMTRVRNSPSLPVEMKLPRTISISGWVSSDKTK
jgi:hypothetical protein